jgi:phage tail tape-measure protein
LKFASGQMQFPEGRGAQKDMMQIWKGHTKAVQDEGSCWEEKLWCVKI